MDWSYPGNKHDVTSALLCEVTNCMLYKYKTDSNLLFTFQFPIIKCEWSNKSVKIYGYNNHYTFSSQLSFTVLIFSFS